MVKWFIVNIPVLAFLIVTQEQRLVTNILQMFEGRMDDLHRLLVQYGIPPNYLKDPDKCEGLMIDD